MSALEDYQVDRSEVYARISKGAQLTDTNRTIGLLVVRVCSPIPRSPGVQRPARGESGTAMQQCRVMRFHDAAVATG